MSGYWSTHNPDIADDRTALARRCYQLRLQGMDDYQIAEDLGISPAEINTWVRTGAESAPKEETDREIEIARVNAWNLRLEQLWDELNSSGVYGSEQLELWIHRFIVSFDKLSRGRRALGGLDKPSKVITSTQAGPMESVDDAIQRLAEELGIND